MLEFLCLHFNSHIEIWDRSRLQFVVPWDVGLLMLDSDYKGSNDKSGETRFSLRAVKIV